VQGSDIYGVHRIEFEVLGQPCGLAEWSVVIPGA